ncbi:MAG: sensor histidine kinase [Scytonema sp. RU_4_4]|nr:sensor histidine kinase [Scytonema sp. RU_4_4]NJR73357.1 sensor histidine kinase [Scytonema sp. CRU_2_7]
MNRLIQFQSHPFRLLLYLEWILLGITLLLPARPPHMPHQVFLQQPLLLFLCIACFGIMGLRLPTINLFSKVLYTGLELGLILLVSVINNSNGFGPPLPLIPLLLILVIRSCLVFNVTGRLLVAGLAFMVFTTLIAMWYISLKDVPFLPQKPTSGGIQGIFWHFTLNSTLLFGLVLVFVLLLVNALLAERQSREKLAIAHQQLREYAHRIEDQATLQERNRIAREIHDALGHSLTAQSIQLENALLFLSSNVDKARTFLEEAKQLGSSALREVRQSVATLRRDPLHGKSLESSLALLLADFQRRTNIIPECTLSLPRPLSAEISTTIYRIVQEALTNISKHSGATQVKINLYTTAKSLHLHLYDNGKGFNPNQNTTGFGIQGMRERTLTLGGQFHIVSTPKAGCQIICNIPLLRLAQ